MQLVYIISEHEKNKENTITIAINCGIGYRQRKVIRQYNNFKSVLFWFVVYIRFLTTEMERRLWNWFLIFIHFIYFFKAKNELCVELVNDFLMQSSNSVMVLQCRLYLIQKEIMWMNRLVFNSFFVVKMFVQSILQQYNVQSILQQYNIESFRVDANDVIMCLYGLKI